MDNIIKEKITWISGDLLSVSMYRNHLIYIKDGAVKGYILISDFYPNIPHDKVKSFMNQADRISLKDEIEKYFLPDKVFPEGMILSNEAKSKIDLMPRKAERKPEGKKVVLDSKISDFKLPLHKGLKKKKKKSSDSEKKDDIYKIT